MCLQVSCNVNNSWVDCVQFLCFSDQHRQLKDEISRQNKLKIPTDVLISTLEEDSAAATAVDSQGAHASAVHRQSGRKMKGPFSKLFSSKRRGTSMIDISGNGLEPSEVQSAKQSQTKSLRKKKGVSKSVLQVNDEADEETTQGFRKDTYGSKKAKLNGGVLDQEKANSRNASRKGKRGSSKRTGNQTEIQSSQPMMEFSKQNFDPAQDPESKNVADFPSNGFPSDPFQTEAFDAPQTAASDYAIGFETDWTAFSAESDDVARTSTWFDPKLSTDAKNDAAMPHSFTSAELFPGDHHFPEAADKDNSSFERSFDVFADNRFSESITSPVARQFPNGNVEEEDAMFASFALTSEAKSHDAGDVFDEHTFGDSFVGVSPSTKSRNNNSFFHPEKKSKSAFDLLVIAETDQPYLDIFSDDFDAESGLSSPYDLRASSVMGREFGSTQNVQFSMRPTSVSGCQSVSNFSSSMVNGSHSRLDKPALKRISRMEQPFDDPFFAI